MDFEKYLEKAQELDLRSNAEKEQAQLRDTYAAESRALSEQDQRHNELLPIWKEVTRKIVAKMPPHDKRFLPGEKVMEYSSIRQKGIQPRNWSGQTTPRQQRRTQDKLETFFDKHSVKAWDMCIGFSWIRHDPESGDYRVSFPIYLGEDGRIFVDHSGTHPGITYEARLPLIQNYGEVAQGLANLVVKFNL